MDIVIYMKRSDHAYFIRQKSQLATLASSARQEIVDLLSRMGTVSVAELAASLGRPADAIYYHLRVLKQSGLVIQAGKRNRGRRPEELFRTVSSNLRLQYKTGEGGNGREISAIVGSMLRMGIRDFRRTFQSSDAKVSGSDRELWALRSTGWLTPKEIVSVNQSMKSLSQAVSKPHGKGRLYAITVLLTPLDHRARSNGLKAIHRKERNK
jgi:DNA-binding transcriptional ArsR family regulator